MKCYGPDLDNIIFMSNDRFCIIGDKYKIAKHIILQKRSYFYMFEIEQNKVINLSKIKSEEYFDFLNCLQHVLDNIIFL